MQHDHYDFKKLVTLIKLEHREIVVIYFYAVLSGLIQLSLPLGIQTILGFVMGATLVTSVYLLIFCIILAVLLVGILQINQMKVIEKIQQKIFVRFAFEFADKILKFDLKEIDNYYLPEKINRFFDIVNLQKGISKLLLDIPAALIQVLFGLILLSLYNSLFILFSLILVIISWSIWSITAKKGLETSITESNHKYAVVAWLEEMGRVIKSLKYSQGTHLNLLKTDEKTLHYIHSRTAHFRVLLLQFKSLVFFKVSITALMLVLGTYLLFNQQINIGQFVAAEIVILTIINSLEKLITSLENVYDVVTALHKLDSIVNHAPEKDGSFSLNASSLHITISHLNFSYNKDQEVFKNVSLTIPSNAITCISGEENSGKSTLLKLLTGSYRDFKGAVTVNNIPIQNYVLESFRAQTGVLLYEQDLFEGTLYENITLGRSSVSYDEIIQLGKKLGIENFIYPFPNSFDTIIDPLGRKLPSSLVKKILLLRALIHNPLLIILEEPWQGLDLETKMTIQKYLIEISTYKTIVLSTNDKEFIQKCNHHILLKEGTAFTLK